MQKYKRHKEQPGRAWARKFRQRNPNNVDWRGQAPVVSAGVSSETFANSYIAHAYKEPDEFKQINIRLQDKFQRLTLFYKPSGECYFVWTYISLRVKFISIRYPDRKLKLRQYEEIGERSIRWLCKESL